MTDSSPRTDETASAPEERFAILTVATADAERWLARWLREGAQAGQPPDVRDFNAAVTALRRLIDARKALRELQRDDPSRSDGEDTQSVDRQIRQALERLEPGGEEPGDPDALPD